ncbi:helix-turn-helix transcriptional regulator [Sporolactobacillus vineae]|uniref:helix-turn-helix transcriptional regulator n=1 Tax=Sporolactobacillus vineae TaxID=444463 RepID=UPI000288901B|nr:AraC family transcriptional regulator [Sporolactobacillus vineae]
MQDICFYFISIAQLSRRLNASQVKLLIPIHGSVMIITPEGRKCVEETQLCLLPFQHTYLTDSSVSNESLVINLPVDYADLYLHDMPVQKEGAVIKISPNLLPVRELLIREVIEDHREEAVLLLHYLLRKTAVKPDSLSLRFIRQHYTEKIDIRALAEMEHYTPSYYCGWFKRKMQMTPLEYIHFLRIHRAKELLRDSHLSMLTISYQLGYEYNASFTRMFKRYEKQSPSEYRASLQQ